MLNEIKNNFISSFVYKKEFLLINIILILSLLLSSPDILSELSFYFFLLIFNLIFLLFLGRRRSKQLNEIENIIKKIRNNIFKTEEEIKLSGELKNLEIEIRKMFSNQKNDIEYLKRLEKMRTEFLGNVSHELRTPIFAIQGFLETLLNGAINDPKVNKQFLEKANNHTINLSNLLNDLIDLSMIESGEMRMSFRYIDFYEYLTPIINEFKLTAEEKGLELILNPFNEKLQLFGDKNKIKQVMVNLISNAIKYTDKGKIEVSVQEEKLFAKIIIKDTGVGIPEEDINRIFERFYRVDKARSREVGGTGLGLAIVKHIIEAHNSKIEVNSKFNEGTEISFTLKK